MLNARALYRSGYGRGTSVRRAVRRNGAASMIQAMARGARTRRRMAPVIRTLSRNRRVVRPFYY